MKRILACLLLPALAAANTTLEQRVDRNHYAYRPAGNPPYATVIAVPGCSGVAAEANGQEQATEGLSPSDKLFRSHVREASQHLQQAGFLVLLIDLPRAEGVLTGCDGEIGSERIAAYLDAAIAYAAGFPFVDGGRIHLIGWGQGGGGVIEWMHGPRSQAGRVHSAVAVYPDCRDAAEPNLPVPLRVFLAGGDDVTDPSTCARLLQSGSAGNARFVVYPQALHGFDVEDAPDLLDIGDQQTMGYEETSAKAVWRAIRDLFERR